MFQFLKLTSSQNVSEFSSAIIVSKLLPSIRYYVNNVMEGKILTGNSAINEVLEYLLKEMGGKTIFAKMLEKGLAAATSPWHFFQIPVEIITYGFYKLMKKDDEFAKMVAKLAKLGTRVSIGFLGGGKCGALASAIFLIVCEFAGWLIFKLLDIAMKKIFSAQASVEFSSILRCFKNCIKACVLLNSEESTKKENSDEKPISGVNYDFADDNLTTDVNDQNLDNSLSEQGNDQSLDENSTSVVENENWDENLTSVGNNESSNVAWAIKIIDYSAQVENHLHETYPELFPLNFVEND